MIVDPNVAQRNHVDKVSVCRHVKGNFTIHFKTEPLYYCSRAVKYCFRIVTQLPIFISMENLFTNNNNNMVCTYIAS